MAGLFDFSGFGLGNQNWFTWQGQPSPGVTPAQAGAGQPMQLTGTQSPVGTTPTGTPAYSPEMVANARYSMLAQAGMQLMAAGQPMSGAQRAQYLSQLGQLPAHYQESLATQLEQAQKQKAYQQQQQQQAYLSNMSTEELVKAGFTPEQATIFKGMGAPADIMERKAFPAASGSGNLGMELRYWTDEKGVQHAGQLMPGGGVKEVQLPPGSQWSFPMQNLDVGTGYVRVPQRGGGTGEVIPKDVSGEAQQKETGKSRADAAQAYPAAASAANDASALIDNLLADQNGMQWAVGASSSYGAAVPGTPGYDYAARVDNLKGKVFLQAYQQLKGAGAITEAEGAAATAAIANLDRSQSEGQFQTALMQLKEVLKRGLDNLQTKAGVQAQPSAVRKYNPQTGELE